MVHFKNSYSVDSLNSIREHMSEYYAALILNDIYQRLFAHIVTSGKKEPLVYAASPEHSSNDIVQQVTEELLRLGYKVSFTNCKYTVSMPSVEDCDDDDTGEY